ncbi:RNA exonuclease 3 [Trichoderma ghanense]|uniref:RNA exonuclease 3 n=1 Tax=Trichoderma ghanense TaxID=65468 RepID=A0ABY2H2H1_9HYPO
MASSSHQPSTKLQHRGNTYSQLTTKQQSIIHAQLPLQCHSLETLTRSGILLDTDPFPQGISSKKPEGLNMTDFLPTPSRNPSIQRRKAIVMTCQAAESPGGGTQPISICVIDFFTGRTLVDSFIAPSCEVSDWKTEVHGISARTIEKAVKGNNCLRGWREARTRLFEYVSAQTVFVGFGLGRELEMLRVFHRGVVDGRVLALEALFTGAERARADGMKLGWEIERVCKGLLGMEMRGGDAYEDVLVAREIVLRFLRREGDVVEWVKRERLEMFGTALKEEEEEEDAMGKSAKRAGRGSKKRGRKKALNANQEVNEKAMRSGNRRRDRAAGVADSVSQSLKELNIGEAVREPRQNGKQKAVEVADGDVNHVKNQSKNNENSKNGKARRKTRKQKKKMETKAQDNEAKREASLKAMVQEEERNLLTHENGKQGARRDWETRNRAERRAKWVESQRDD